MYSNDPGLNARICRDHDEWLLKGLPDGDEDEENDNEKQDEDDDLC